VKDPRLPVLIIGAGPVGLSLALALARRQVRVRVFEAKAELNSEARASTLHPPTLEMFAEWGLIDELLARGQRVDRLLYWERASRQLVAEFDFRLLAGNTPYPFRLLLPQHLLTRLLKPAIEATGFGRVQMEHRFIDFAEQDNCVTAWFETPQGLCQAAGAYLCGADGAQSSLRRRLGLGFDGMTYEDRFLQINIDLDLAPFYPGIGLVNYIFDPDEWVIVLSFPTFTRVIFRLASDEDEAQATDPEALRRRLWRFLAAQPEFAIESWQIYRVHQRVAERFRLGRALLLGDAAHINNPSASIGMNSGIHDAHHLAAALAQVLDGAPTTLLDEYSRVRRRIAIERVHASAHRFYADISERQHDQRQARNLALRALAADPVRARAYLLELSMMEHWI
jgi:3-(3-hydroxy-phenyl)propionate hydroxylase